MSVSVPSDKDKDRLMQAFHNMVKDSSDKKLEEWIPEHYWELEKYVFHNCLLTSLMRKVPFCLRCSSFVKSDSFFCPNCRKENALCPLYRDCKTRKCIHEERVKEDIRNFGIYPNSPISSIEFLNCNNSRDNYAMCSVQQEHQRGAHSMIRDRTYRPVLVSYIIPRVIRNSLISRVRPCLMLLLNTTHRVVAIHIGVLEKRGD